MKSFSHNPALVDTLHMLSHTVHNTIVLSASKALYRRARAVRSCVRYRFLLAFRVKVAHVVLVKRNPSQATTGVVDAHEEQARLWWYPHLQWHGNNNPPLPCTEARRNSLVFGPSATPCMHSTNIPSPGSLRPFPPGPSRTLSDQWHAPPM